MYCSAVKQRAINFFINITKMFSLKPALHQSLNPSPVFFYSFSATTFQCRHQYYQSWLCLLFDFHSHLQGCL